MSDTTPSSANKLPGVTARSAAPWIISILFLLVMPYIFTSNSAITIMNQMAITIIFALSYNMLLGQGGMLSFGHAVYMGVGGFMVMHVMNMVEDYSLPLPLPVLPLFGGLFGLGLATIVGAFSTRRAGTVFAMISLGVGELIAASSIIVVAFFGGEEGIPGDRTYGLPFFGNEFLHPIDVYYLIGFWLILSALLMYLFSRTPAGRMANAVRDNPERAEFLGYSARRVRYISFCAAGFFAGVAGGLFGINYEILTEENLNLALSGQILLITFLGGIGFFFGPIIGAIVFTLLQTVLSLQTELWQLYVGVLFVATVMYFPGGLAGVLMMHAASFKLGKANLLVVPYIKTLVPAFFGLMGAAGFIEIMFHIQSAAVGESEMTLFWITFDSHSPVPTAISLLVAGVGFWLAKRSAPEMADAWHRSITPDVPAPAPINSKSADGDAA